MPRPAIKRAFASLRRVLRRRRAPSPSEQEWLRLILLVRRLQHGQLAFVQRLDEIRALTGHMGSFRSDFAALHEQLGAARTSAGELERGLAERLGKLDGLPDAKAERADIDGRLATFDGLAARLETLAAQSPAGEQPSPELEAALARLNELAGRLESVQAAERSVGGQDELARLYERIEELAESVARRPAEPSGGASDATAADMELHVARLGEQLETFDCALEALGSGESLEALGETLSRLEKLARRFEKRSSEFRAGALTSGEMAGLLSRFEAIAERIELAPSVLPELPADTLAGGATAAEREALGQELQGLRAAMLVEQESRRRGDEELASLRERLRASELARVELETRHTSELTQMADHVQRQLQRVEDDLKKKKRGLAELTQQNINLQTQLARLQAGGAATEAPQEPPAPLPSSTSFARRRAERPTLEGEPGA